MTGCCSKLPARTAPRMRASRKLPRLRSDTQGAADVDRVLAQHGLAPLSPAHADADGRIDVVIPDAAFAALVRALDDLARESDIRVVAATLLARVEPGSVRAEFVLAR